MKVIITGKKDLTKYFKDYHISQYHKFPENQQILTSSDINIFENTREDNIGMLLEPLCTPKHLNSLRNIIVEETYRGMASYANQCGKKIDEKDKEKVKLAIDEAITNAMEHGTGYNEQNRIGIEIKTKYIPGKKEFHFTTIIHNPNPKVKSARKEGQKGGMGMTLIKQIMDYVNISKDYRTVELTKIIKVEQNANEDTHALT